MVTHRIKIRDSSTVNSSSSVIINLVGVPSSTTTKTRGRPQHLRTDSSSSKTSSRVNIVLNPNSHQMATSSSTTITTLSNPRKEYIIIILNKTLNIGRSQKCPRRSKGWPQPKSQRWLGSLRAPSTAQARTHSLRHERCQCIPRSAHDDDAHSSRLDQLR